MRRKYFRFPISAADTLRLESFTCLSSLSVMYFSDWSFCASSPQHLPNPSPLLQACFHIAVLHAFCHPYGKSFGMLWHPLCNAFCITCLLLMVPNASQAMHNADTLNAQQRYFWSCFSSCRVLFGVMLSTICGLTSWL